MIQFRRNSYANIILEYISLCGEFPYQSLEMMNRNKRILQRTINNLKKEGYITITGTGPMKTIRVTKKAFPIIEAINPDFLKHYLIVSENHHFRGGTYKNNKVGARQVWRRHRMAEILCIFKQLNVKLWQEEKPKLHLNTKEEKRINLNDLIFYTSKELKNIDVNQRYKTDFTRIMGALFSPGGVYCVYNTNKGLMKWNSQGEGKAQVLVEDIVNQNLKEYKSKLFEANSAIMFGKGMEPALEMLISNGGKRDSNGFEMLSFDNTYRNIFYLTLDDNGRRQLNIMTKKNWHDILKEEIFPEEYINFKYSNIDCDAIDKNNNKYILMFFDGNVGRLKRFKQASYDSAKNNFEVLCFSWQANFIKEYMEDNVTCRILSIDDIEEIFK